jgi:hypothetical protein
MATNIKVLIGLGGSLSDGVVLTIESTGGSSAPMSDSDANNLADALAGLGLEWGSTGACDTVTSINIVAPREVTVT